MSCSGTRRGARQHRGRLPVARPDRHAAGLRRTAWRWAGDHRRAFLRRTRRHRHRTRTRPRRRGAWGGCGQCRGGGQFTPGNPHRPDVAGTAASGDATGSRVPDAAASPWNALPSLAAAAAVGRTRPGAEVLAMVSGPAGEPQPLVAVQRAGRGRTMVFTGEGAWRWRMGLASGNRRLRDVLAAGAAVGRGAGAAHRVRRSRTAAARDWPYLSRSASSRPASSR